MFEKTGVPVYIHTEVCWAAPGVDSGKLHWKEGWRAAKEAAVEGFQVSQKNSEFILEA